MYRFFNTKMQRELSSFLESVLLFVYKNVSQFFLLFVYIKSCALSFDDGSHCNFHSYTKTNFFASTTECQKDFSNSYFSVKIQTPEKVPVLSPPLPKCVLICLFVFKVAFLLKLVSNSPLYQVILRSVEQFFNHSHGQLQV